MIDLRFGRWQDTLKDVDECAAVITDPPYSVRQSEGYRSGSEKWDKKIKTMKSGSEKRKSQGRTSGGIPGSLIPYKPIDQNYTNSFCEFWAPRVKNWMLFFCDHESFLMWEKSLKEQNWITFAPVPWIRRNGPPRFAGDGPASSTEYICIARPKGRLEKKRIGSRPGYYICNIENSQSNEKILTGQKPLSLMRKIILDYTLKNDLIVEPHAGSGTTLLASVIEGRCAIGSEMDPNTYKLAKRRIERGYTPILPGI